MSLSKLISGHPDEVQAKRERRKEARPGELLDAALDLFVEKGFAATRAEEVAARAGVSKGTLFLYFPSKEDLFKAAVRENISGRFGEWNEELAQFEGSTPDLLRHFLRMWWERVGATRASGLTKLIFSEASNFPDIAAFYHKEVVEPGNQLIRKILQRGVDRGEFVVPDMEYARYSIVAPVIFLSMMKHSMGACLPQGYTLDAERYLAAQAEMLLHGLCVRQENKSNGRSRK
ncbi:MAG TPA: TetR/AcrR family transcriptional regulator [Ramlibacter sp.]|nr:TetR/AcrR family transcriptional regulator [Ramlibacter sp.]